LSRPVAVLGGIVLATSPLYIFHASQLLSDVPALVWTTAAILLAARSGASLRAAAGAGAAFAIAVLIRPTNVLAIVPLAILLQTNVVRWGVFVAGGLPAVGILAWFNLHAYGAVASSGYGPIWREFAWRYAPGTLLHYLRWLPVLLTPGILFAGLLPWLSDHVHFPRRALVAWALVFPLCYAFYSFTHEGWWWLRFILPSFPALILAALLGVRLFVDRLPREAASGTASVVWPLGAIAIIAWALGWNSHLAPLATSRHQADYQQATRWARENLAPNSVILAMQTTGALYRYTNFCFVRWDFVTPSDAIRLEAARIKEHRPWAALLFPFEERPAFAAVPGAWHKVTTVAGIAVWQRADVPPAPAP
jgi:hypothetical protein